MTPAAGVDVINLTTHVMLRTLYLCSQQIQLYTDLFHAGNCVSNDVRSSTVYLLNLPDLFTLLLDFVVGDFALAFMFPELQEVSQTTAVKRARNRPVLRSDIHVHVL